LSQITRLTDRRRTDRQIYRDYTALHSMQRGNKNLHSFKRYKREKTDSQTHMQTDECGQPDCLTFLSPILLF